MMWWRTLVIVLLALGLPLQGWAASRMAVTMASSQSVALASVQVGLDEASVLMPAESMGGPDAHHHASCCAGDEGDHSAAALGDGHCGEQCHCCVTAGFPRETLVPPLDAPTHEWRARPQAQCLSGPMHTLDKPPKA